MFRNKLRKITKLLTTAVITGAVFTSVSAMSAGAADIWQSDYEVGNYITDAPYGTVIGSIPANTAFTVLSSVTAYDGTVWGLCVDGGYICLDYCTNIQADNNASAYDFVDNSWQYSFMNGNQQYIYSHFINKGIPSESAAAVASNLFNESGCDTNAFCIDINGLVSYGICQWNGERYNNLYLWCSANGYDYTSLDGQLAYLDYELENEYFHVFSQLMTGGNVWNMAYIWASQFEICSSDYWNTRGDNAVSLYNNIR
ncbi:MAG: hypothetical protein K2J47_01295 [Ruminococcus sp.]|nr:hypothetical protein [Ruminococcus sp.]